jgi:hypothetical protein
MGQREEFSGEVAAVAASPLYPVHMLALTRRYQLKR